MLLCAGRQSVAKCFVRHLQRKPFGPPKPHSLPWAKSARYRVVHVRWMDVDDVRELLWRRHAYYDAIASIRALFKSELAELLQKEQRADETTSDLATVADLEDPIFQARLRENFEWNKQKQAERQSREMEEMQKVTEAANAEVEQYVEAQRKRREENERRVLEAIERSKDFVTYDNLEAKIVEALENPSDPGFAITEKGEVICGNNYQKYLVQPPTLDQKPISELSAPKRISRTLLPASQKQITADDRPEQKQIASQ